MSKPINALELPTPFDLTECSLDDAIEQAKEYAKEIEWDRLGYQVLKIPSQLMPQAVPLVSSLSLPIEVDFTYDMDEWSYHMYSYNREVGDFDEIAIWSPGA